MLNCPTYPYITYNVFINSNELKCSTTQQIHSQRGRGPRHPQPRTHKTLINQFIASAKALKLRMDMPLKQQYQLIWNIIFLSAHK